VKLTTSWKQLPPAVREHLQARLKERSISEDDLYKLKFWIEQPPGPDAPEGDWFCDFGTFKICGRGSLVLTFLRADQAGYGTEIDRVNEE
jgi:hypothetical protein